MDFVAVVDQAMALLRQRGRLTYRTLQLQFQLDAEHLEALKDELIEGQRLAVDVNLSATPTTRCDPPGPRRTPPGAASLAVEHGEERVALADPLLDWEVLK